MDREKVIKGLEQFIADFRPFCGNKSDWKRVDDTLALLKAQEPRVMTLEELEDWDGAVFFEAFETDMYYVLIDDVNLMAGIKGQYSFVNVEPGQWNAHIWGGEHYGSIWRCWTSRPTDEQREAVKWE